jgi:hypothetical protein
MKLTVKFGFLLVEIVMIRAPRVRREANTLLEVIFCSRDGVRVNIVNKPSRSIDSSAEPAQTMPPDHVDQIMDVHCHKSDTASRV